MAALSAVLLNSTPLSVVRSRLSRLIFVQSVQTSSAQEKIITILFRKALTFTVVLFHFYCVPLTPKTEQ